MKEGINMADQDVEQEVTQEKPDVVEEICDWINSVLFGIFVVLIIFTFVVKQVRVDGSSMEPTLETGQRLFVSNWFYTPENGDIVVAKSESLNKDIIKRVIAKEGQVVDIDFENGIVYVDGEQLYEPYIKDLTKRDELGHDYPVTVPEDCYFVMGDNRMNSKDSRSPEVGFINNKDIFGKAIFRWLPIKKFGGLYD